MPTLSISCLHLVYSLGFPASKVGSEQILYMFLSGSPALWTSNMGESMGLWWSIMGRIMDIECVYNWYYIYIWKRANREDVHYLWCISSGESLCWHWTPAASSTDRFAGQCFLLPALPANNTNNIDHAKCIHLQSGVDMFLF